MPPLSGHGQVREVLLDVEERRARDVTRPVELAPTARIAHLPAAVDEPVAHATIVSLRVTGYNAQWMRTRLLVLTGILLAVAAVALTAGGAYAYFWENGRSDLLASGITVAGVDVGGMHASDARALLEQRLVARLRTPLRLTAGSRSFVVDPMRAGLRIDVDGMVSRALAASRSGGLAHRLTSQGKQAELLASVHADKERLAVLEVIQRGDGAAISEITEQVLTAGAAGDDGLDNAPKAAGRRGDRREPLSEQLVGQ